MKFCSNQSNCCTALPQLLSHLWTRSRHSRPVGNASPPLLQQDLSFALSAAGKSIPDMQLSSQVTLAGSDLGEGHSPSELMPLGGHGNVHRHRHPQLSRRGVWFHTPAPSGLLPTPAASNRSRASLALTPHPLCPLLPLQSWCRQLPSLHMPSQQARWRRSSG